MTREELIEKVALAFCNIEKPIWAPNADELAAIAIDIVLEEAAKIATAFDEGRQVYDARGNLQNSSAGEKIAKRIRALKGE